MPTAHELQRNAELRKALLDAEMRYQQDAAAARAQYQAGLDPANFPAYDAAMKAADRARAARIEAAYQTEREVAATEFAPAAPPQSAAARTRR
jgi:uncharacterized membrane protein